MSGLVVTGGANGIGAAIVLAAADRGIPSAILDRDPKATGVAEQAERRGAPRAIALHCDVTDEDSVAHAMGESRSVLGGVSGVVANAGIERNGALHEMDRRTWDSVLDANLSGVYLTVKHALRAMLQQGGGGSIVCMSSPSAFVGFAGGGNAAYGASKGGITAMVRSVAIDYAAAGIRVNALVPGATDTALLRSELDEKAARELDAAARREIPLGRLAQPAEIAAAALWLLGPESGYVTGSSLVCDGGLLAKGANTI